MAFFLGDKSAEHIDLSIETLKQRIQSGQIPEHIAIIMDGNGRWAKRKLLPSRLLGHREGYKTTKKIVQAAVDLDIKVLTLYVFSNENWRRPKQETDGLMALYEHATRAELDELHSNGVQMRFIGRRTGLTPSLLAEIERAETLTAQNSKLVLNLALNYGGRTEIVDAVRIAAERVRTGDIAPQDIDENLLSGLMYSSDLPDPDLLIRTAGELRISNFLLWTIAYSEIWVTDTLWPDFQPVHLVEAIQAFQNRVRKFGAVVTQP